VFEALRRWITQELAHDADPIGQPKPDRELLLTGLRRDDAVRWEIGVAHAWIDPAEDSIWLEGMPKPNIQHAGEGLTSRRLFDFEGLFVTLWQIAFCAGRRSNKCGNIALRDSESKSKRLYHYPAIYTVRLPRLLANVPADAQSRMAGLGDFRDLRRRNLRRGGLNKATAARRFKHGNSGRLSRTRADVAADACQQYIEAGGDAFLPLDEYERLLWAGYRLLDDRHPLAERTPRPKKT
jgi:hypothetical protein